MPCYTSFYLTFLYTTLLRLARAAGTIIPHHEQNLRPTRGDRILQQAKRTGSIRQRHRLATHFSGHVQPDGHPQRRYEQDIRHPH